MREAVLIYAVSQKISHDEEREMGELFKSIDTKISDINPTLLAKAIAKHENGYAVI